MLLLLHRMTLVSFGLFRRNLGNLGKWFTAPWQKIARNVKKCTSRKCACSYQAKPVALHICCFQLFTVGLDYLMYVRLNHLSNPIHYLSLCYTVLTFRRELFHAILFHLILCWAICHKKLRAVVFKIRTILKSRYHTILPNRLKIGMKP